MHTEGLIHSCEFGLQQYQRHEEGSVYVVVLQGEMAQVKCNTNCQAENGQKVKMNVRSSKSSSSSYSEPHNLILCSDRATTCVIFIAVHVPQEDKITQRTRYKSLSKSENERNEKNSIVIAHVDRTSVYEVYMILSTMATPCTLHMCGAVDDENGEGKFILNYITKVIERLNMENDMRATNFNKQASFSLGKCFVGRRNTTVNGGAHIGGLGIDTKTMKVFPWRRSKGNQIPCEELRMCRLYCAEYMGNNIQYQQGNNHQSYAESHVSSLPSENCQILSLYNVYSDYEDKIHELRFQFFDFSQLTAVSFQEYMKYCLSLGTNEEFLKETSTTPSGEDKHFVDSMRRTFQFVLSQKTDPFKGKTHISYSWNVGNSEWVRM